MGFEEIYLPHENAEEAALIDGIKIYGAKTLREVIDHLNEKKDNGNIQMYRINKDYSTWKPLSKKITVIKNDNKSLSKKRPSIDNTKEITPPTPSKGDAGAAASHDVERLEKFWSAYPRKGGREKLEAVWKILLPAQELLETMLKTLEVQKKSPEWKKESGRFIPFPAKWLQDRKWEDAKYPEAVPALPPIKREVYSSEDLAKFDQAREKGLSECKKLLGKG